MKRTLAILLLALAPLCHAETFPSVDAARAFADKVMEKVAAGEIEEGLKMIKPYAIVPAAEFDAMVGQTSLQLPMITQRFGKSIGSEFIRQDAAGDSLVRLLYISKHERHAMRWFFYLYRTPEGWVVNTFNFDDQIHLLFPQ